MAQITKFTTFVLTLSGSAESLASLVSGIDPEPPLAQVLLQADPGNAAVVYIGSDNTVDAAGTVGFQVPIPVTSIPAAPISLGPVNRALFLSDIWVKGTGSQKLRVTVIPWQQ